MTTPDSRPAPLVPPDTDLHDLDAMLLDVRRLRESSFAATTDPASGFFGVLLWCAAWHQIPAGSLPGDDAAIAGLAGFGRGGEAAWAAVREGALRGFIRCQDGRYYHPIVCQKALQQWVRRLEMRLRGGRGNQRRHNAAFDPAPLRARLAVAHAALARLEAGAPYPVSPLPVAPPEPPEPGDPPPPPSQAGSQEGSQDASQVRSQKASRKRSQSGSQVRSQPRSEVEGEVKGEGKAPPFPPEGGESKALPPEPDYLPGFLAFWAVYPKKHGKKAAYKAWLKHEAEEFATTLVQDVRERRRKDGRWLKQNGEFVPDPATYLNGHRWNDAMQPLNGVRSGVEQQNRQVADEWGDLP